MIETCADTYQCPDCGQTYPWRPESAGRPVRCDCESSLVVPFSPGEASHSNQRGRALPIRRREVVLEKIKQEEQAPEDSAAPATESRRIIEPLDVANHWGLAIPSGLAVIGLVLEVVLLAYALRPHSAWHAIAYTPLILLLAMGTVAVVCLADLFLLPLFDVSLGPVKTMVPKLAAAVIFPAATGGFIEIAFNNSATGITLGWLASAVCYLVLFRLFFDFEWSDTMVIISCVCLAHTAVLFMVLWPLTLDSMQLPDIWKSFGPIIFQSLATFTISGSLIIPHFRRQ